MEEDKQSFKQQIYPLICNCTEEKCPRVEAVLSKFSTFIKERDSKMWGYYKQVFEEGFEGGYPAQWDDFIS